MTREEAIKVASEMYGWVKTDREKEALETLVPELAESEDEKMRKFLLNYFKFRLSHPDVYINNTMWEGVKVSDIIAYLEKQKEATNFAELTSKLSANEQDIMFNAWPKGEWTKKDDDMIQALYNCIDELHEVYSWNYVYTKGGNIHIGDLKGWVDRIERRIKKDKQ